MFEPKKPAIPKHPVRGYVTEQQWIDLQRLGFGPDYDQLKKQIALQTQKKGVME